MSHPTCIEEITSGIESLDPEWLARARQHTEQLVMPTRALGRLHDIAERFCAIQQTLEPIVGGKGILVMAGDHGIADEGVSAYPQEVTGGMVQTFLAGGAGINAIARTVDAQVRVVDMGIIPHIPEASYGGQYKVTKIGLGTANFAKGPAMSREQAEKAVMTGFVHASDFFSEGIQLLGTGDMGIANTTPSAAIGAAVTGASLDDMVGRGTGVDDVGLMRKRETIAQGLTINAPTVSDGLDVLAKVGGFEIGGIAGAILAAAYHRKSVVIDGFISTAGALIAHLLCPVAMDYVFAGHQSEEPGHELMLDHLGLSPLLNLGLRLGEGTGGALAMAVIQGALQVFNDVMTFEEAGVPKD